MRILVIAAMSKELDLILRRMPGCEASEAAGSTVYIGNIGEHEIIASQCGIGKVNAALRTASLIDAYRPDLVVNSGVAGGADASMHIGDVLVAEGVAYHDVWCGPGTEYGAADGFPVVFRPWNVGIETMRRISADEDRPYRFGLLCSGDKFISSPEEVSEINSHFPDALGCDMESASIAQVCAGRGVPFMIVRVMSDMPGGGENIAEYSNFWAVAPERTFEALFRFINSIHK